VDPDARRLYDALTEGFGPYVRAKVASYGLTGSGLEAAVDAAVRTLEAELERLLDQPGAVQTATPLEVVREALRPLTDALARTGVEPPERDEQQVAALPGDPYDLAPASAADISESAWEASLAWGASKAAAVRRPVLVVVSTNLMDAGPFEAAARRTGHDCVFVGPADVPPDPAIAFVDLEVEGSDAVISDLAGGDVRVIAYGPHVDSFAMTRARSLGAAAAEPRSRVLRDPSAFVAPVV